MGPKLFSFKKGETTYSLRLFPIGGYCAMEGEDEDSDNPRAFNNAKIWKRMIIIVAGAFMNIVFGLMLMVITLLPMDCFNSTTISAFSPYSFTATTGLQQGDEIIEINDYDINSSMDFSYAMYTMPLCEVDGKSVSIYKQDCLFELKDSFNEVAKSAKEDQFSALDSLWVEGADKIYKATDKDSTYKVMCEYIDKSRALCELEKVESYPVIEERDSRQRFRSDIVVLRDGKEVLLKDVDFLTYKTSENGEPTIGIDFYVEPIEKTFTSVLSQTFIQTGSVVRTVWNSLVGLITGQFGINEVAGPVGLAYTITDVAGESLKEGFSDAVMSIVYVMMVISINLGIVNMLPFPALDGGRFVLLLIEAIFRKPVPRKVEGYINAAGLILLLLLMAVITMKDVWVYVFGG